MKKLLISLFMTSILFSTVVCAEELSLPTGGYVSEITEICDDNNIDNIQENTCVESNVYYSAEPTVNSFSDFTYTDFYGYNTLLKENKNLADAYVTVMNGLANKSTEIDIAIYQLDKDAANKVFYACTNDNPQFYYILNTGYKYSIGTYVSKLYPLYITDLVSKDGFAEFDSAAEKIIKNSGVREGMSEYDIALMLYNEIILQTVYDNDALNIINQAGSSGDKTTYDNTVNQYGYIHSAYGTIVNHKAVCDGYARAYQYLLYKMGIMSHITTGEAGGGGHAWNLVKLDGKWYYTDVTWGDDDTNNSVFYSFLNMSDKLSTDSGHTVNNPYQMPVCNSDDLFYFNVSGGIMTTDGDIDNVASQLKHNSYARVYVTGDKPSDIWTWFTENSSAIVGKAGINPYSIGRAGKLNEYHLYMLYKVAAPLKNIAIDLTTSEDINCTVYFAFYDENDLLTGISQVNNVELTSGLPQTINCTDIPENYKKVKYFIWNDADKISPIYESITETYSINKS